MTSTKSITIKQENAFVGIVIGVFEDIGPIARYNRTKIPKDVVNTMVVHGMSAVHAGEDMLGGLFGPLPVFQYTKLRYLIYSFKVKATNTKDSRIEEHGRVCSIFLILKESQERYALNNHLTIEKILVEFTERNWTKELDITKASMLSLFSDLNEIVRVKNIRSLSFGEAGIIEYADPQQMLDDGILIVIDMKLNRIHMYLPHERFDSRTRIKAIEEIENLNLREFGSKLQIKKYRDYLKFKKVLDKHHINLVK